jgi:hypothetical protein
MATPPMTTLEFLSWYAANHSRVQIGVVAATASIGVVVLASIPLAAGLPAWAAVIAVVAIVTVYLAAAWVTLGTRRVQRWITGL